MTMSCSRTSLDSFRKRLPPFCPHLEPKSWRSMADRASHLRLLERTTGFEPATPTLARLFATS